MNVCLLFFVIFFYNKIALEPINYVAKMLPAKMFGAKMLPAKLLRTPLGVLPKRGRREGQALGAMTLAQEAAPITSPQEAPG